MFVFLQQGFQIACVTDCVMGGSWVKIVLFMDMSLQKSRFGGRKCSSNTTNWKWVTVLETLDQLVWNGRTQTAALPDQNQPIAKWNHYRIIKCNKLINGKDQLLRNAASRIVWTLFFTHLTVIVPVFSFDVLINVSLLFFFFMPHGLVEFL